MGSEFASRQPVHQQQEQAQAMPLRDLEAERRQQQAEILQQLQASIQNSPRLQFLTPPEQSNPLKVQLDADGDLTDDLKLDFVKNGKNVQVTARSVLVANAQTSFTIQPHQPELFYIWHYITSDGRAPYQLFFSLLPQHRAILNLYDELPDDLYRKLAQEIKNSPKRKVPPEVVTGTEAAPQIKSNMGNDKLQLAQYQHPGHLSYIDAADQMTIHTHKNRGAGTVTYTFKHNGQEVGQLAAANYPFPKQAPLITHEGLSPEQPQEKQPTGKQPKEQPDLKTADQQYTTFQIPIKVGRPIERHYQLMVIPGHGNAPASVGVSYQGAEGRFDWRHTFKVRLPQSDTGALIYDTEARSNHLALFFYTRGQSKPKIPQLTIYYQEQMHFNEKKMALLRKNYQGTGNARDLATYELRGLHLYSAQEQHRDFIAYYRGGRLQTGKFNSDEHTLQLEAVQDAREHPVASPPKNINPAEVKEQLFWQENVFIKRAWQHPQMKKQRLVVNNLTQDPYTNIQDRLPQAKTHSINVAQLYPSYMGALLALQALGPLVNSVKAKGGVFARTPKMEALLVALSDDIAAYEQASELGFLQTNPPQSLPGLKTTLTSQLVRQGQLAHLDIPMELHRVEASMLKLTKYFYTKLLQNDLKVPLEKRMAQIDKVKKTGNRRQNFQKYLEDKNLGAGKQMIPIEARFYPKVPAFKQGQPRVVADWLKKNRVPMLNIPLYAHQEVTPKGLIWHIVSLVHHDQGKYFTASLLPLKGKDLQTYREVPPPALFALLDHSDHLPPGWLIYRMAKETARETAGNKSKLAKPQYPPLQIKRHWPPEEIAMWLSVVLLMFGGAAYASKLLPVMGELFLGATVVGGTGAMLANQREKNGTLTKEQRWFNYADMVSAVIGLGTFGRVVKTGGQLQGGKLALQVTGNAVYLFLKAADLGVDTYVVFAMNRHTGQQLAEIMDMPGPIDEKFAAMSKKFAMLALQNILFVGTFKSRGQDVLKTFQEMAEEMFPKMARKMAGNAKAKDKGLLLDQPRTSLITEADAPGLHALKQSPDLRWSAARLEEVAEDIGPKKLNKIARSLDEMDDLTQQSLLKMYPEKDVLYALYASRGRVPQARQRLARYYGVSQEPKAYGHIREEGRAKAHLEGETEHWHIAQQPARQAQQTADSFKTVVDTRLKSLEGATTNHSDLEGKIEQLNRKLTGYEAQKVDAEKNITELHLQIDQHRNKGGIDHMSVPELHYKVDVEWRMQKDNLKARLDSNQRKKAEEDDYVKKYNEIYAKQRRARQAKVEAKKKKFLKRKFKKIKAESHSPKWKTKKQNIEANAERRFQNELNNTEIIVKLPDGTEFKRSIRDHDMHLSKKKELIKSYEQNIKDTIAQIDHFDKKIKFGKKMLGLNDGYTRQDKGLAYWYQKERDLASGQRRTTEALEPLQKALPQVKANQEQALATYLKDVKYYQELQQKAAQAKRHDEYLRAKKNYEAAQKRYAAARKQSQEAQARLRNRHRLLGWYRQQATHQQQLLKHLQQGASLLFNTKSGDVDVDKALWSLCRTFLSLQSLPSGDPVYQPAIAQQMKRELKHYLEGFRIRLANLGARSLEAPPVKNHLEGYQRTEAMLHQLMVKTLGSELKDTIQNLQQELRVLIKNQTLIDQQENKE